MTNVDMRIFEKLLRNKTEKMNRTDFVGKREGPPYFHEREREDQRSAQIRGRQAKEDGVNSFIVQGVSLLRILCSERRYPLPVLLDASFAKDFQNRGTPCASIVKG